jgi:hypothetical protein
LSPLSFRARAFGFHLLGSACVLLLVTGALYLGWYRWPAWYLLDLMAVVGMMAAVDLVLGPLLTFAIANPAKPRRELARDVSVIVVVQLAALIYAVHVLWVGRPLYYTFSADRLEIVRAFEIESADWKLGQELNPDLAPHWYSLPRWVWARMPDDAKLADEIMQSAIGGGPDIVDLPRYFRPWNEGLPELRRQLRPINSLRGLAISSKTRAAAHARELKLPDADTNAMLMTGRTGWLVALFDPQSMRMLALVKTE